MAVLGEIRWMPPVGRTNGRRWGDPIAAVIGGQMSAGGAGEPRWRDAIVKERSCELLVLRYDGSAWNWRAAV